MRDPERIPDICDKLCLVWKWLAPDMRFGQLMEYILTSAKRSTGKDPFYIEDDEMLKIIQQCFENIQNT